MASPPRAVDLGFPWRLLLAAGGGALYFLAFVGFDQWYLSWICLVPLFFALDEVSVRRGLLLGWLFGTVALTGGFSWITHTLHVFAFMPWVVSALGCLVLGVAQATEFALFGLIYAFLRRRTRRGPLLVGTAAFVSAEFVSPQLFPHYFGNALYRQLPLIQISDITGVLGVTALIVFVNAALFVLLRSALRKQPRWRPILAASALVLLALAYGHVRIGSIEARMAAAPKVRFGIAQANLGIHEKKEDPAKALRLNQEMTAELARMGAEIVVWPETAVQAPILTAGAPRLPRAVFGDLSTPILAGALERDPSVPGRPLYNVAVLTDAQGEITGAYRKRKLLMLGEYIPLGERFPRLYDWFPYIGRLTPGDSDEPLSFRGWRLNVNICYEEILPRLMNRMMARSANVIVNLTNDNWFGDTHEPLQHLALAAFRSVEHRRALVRSTNTGISAFVDPTGRIADRTPLLKPAVLVRDAPMMRGTTLYARLGDWVGWLGLAATGVLSLISLERRSREGES